MGDRATLNLRSRVLDLDPSTYANDSQLEQKVIYLEKQASTATATAASGTLTSDATIPADGDTVTIGGVTYTYKTALGDAAATGTITSNNTNVSAADTVTINGQVYTFVTAFGTGNNAYNVIIGATADASLTNLEAAINATAGMGTTYGAGTLPNFYVSSSDVVSHVITLTARSTGTQGNSITLAKSAATLTVSAATLTGGATAASNQVLIGANTTASLANLKSALASTAGAGTTYSASTPKNADVTPGTATATTLALTATNPAYGNSVPTTETSAHLSFGGATLASGVPGVIVSTSLTNAAVSGGANV